MRAEDEFYGVDKTGDELPAELADPSAFSNASLRERAAHG